MSFKKTSKAGLLKMIAEVNQKEGKGTIFTLDEEGKKGIQVPRIKTGIEQLDYVLGGGLPMGKQIGIAGPKSAGKTTLAHFFTSLFEMAMNHPVEGAFSWDRAELFGNEKGQLYVHTTASGESYMNRIQKMAENGMPIQIVDSVPWLRAKKEIEKRKKAAKNNSIEQVKMSATTAVINPYIEAIADGCTSTGAIVVWVNQVRQRMNAAPFQDPFYEPGGEKYQHALDINLRVAKKGWIKIKNHDPRNSATKEAVGMVIKIKCIKNRTAPPERECELIYFYDRGFVSHAEMNPIMKEIEAQRKAFFADKKNWKNDIDDVLDDEWEEGDEDWEDEDWDDE